MELNNFEMQLNGALSQSLPSSVTRQQNISTGVQLEGMDGAGIGTVMPPYEWQSPQYPIPSVYPLAVTGYGKNELIFSCIDLLMRSVSQAPIAEWSDEPQVRGATRKNNSDMIALLDKPNDFMSQSMFWKATVLYKMYAGFAPWEIEFNNLHEPIALYPLRPDWCSFRRSPRKLVGTLRYQVPGVEFVDIPIERCLIFMDLHPLYMGIRAISPSYIAARVGATDNAATDFMTQFFQRGTMVAGILSTEQSLNDTEALRNRARWRETHGGTDNWGDIGVLGNGLKYQPLTMPFKDMDMNNIDGRTEARICSIFGIPPIMLGAKVGLQASTYSNYEQARAAFYESRIADLWADFASVIKRQLMPHFGKDGHVSFDTRHIKALQPDRQALWGYSTNAGKANILSRDEVRGEMGYDPIDNAPVFIGVTVRTDQPGAVEEGGETPAEAANNSSTPPPAGAKSAAKPNPVTHPPAQTAKALAEWRKAAIEAVKAGQFIPMNTGYPEISKALCECKTASDVRAVFEAHWPKGDRPAKADLGALIETLQHATEVLEVTV